MVMSMAENSFGTLLVELGVVSEQQLEEATQRSASSISDALLSLGHVTHTDLKQALDAVKPHGRPRLGDVLVNLEHITPERLESVLQLQSSEKKPLGELLVERGECTYEQVFEGLQAQNTSGSKRIRVLVVDDSMIVCSMLTQGLMDLGYDVVSFENPKKAFEQLQTIQPDIVVSDYEMPELDGAELCRKIKSTTADMPVIILTAHDRDDALVGLQAGADDYVRKGTSMEELGARIDTIMRRTNATSRMRQLFARYTSDAVVEQVLQSGDVVLTGEKREVTVLFVDVRQFTSFAETQGPERVMATLSDVLGRLADAVLAQGGTVDKFLGDGLMAVFGAPMKMEDHARRGMAAAHGMLHAMAARNRDCSPELVLEIGVGVNTGVVVAGSVGNERRTEYTCIGDTVNVASRICALAEPGEIIVGEGTAEALGPFAQVERMEPVKLKGKAQPVPVFRAKR
jgi:adenylate cyclase